MNGGVQIFSKFPILEQKQVVYKGGVKHDQYAAKGAIRITVKIDGQLVNVVGTHLQAGNKQSALDVKQRQFGEMARVVNDNPTVIVGDMNLNSGGVECDDTFQKCKPTSSKQGKFMDKQLEEQGWERTSPTTSTTNKSMGKTQEGNILDHTFVNTSESFKIDVAVEVIEIRADEPYWIDKKREIGIESQADDLFSKVKCGAKHPFSKNKRKRCVARALHKGQKQVTNLSDHHAVMSRIKITTSMDEGFIETFEEKHHHTRKRTRKEKVMDKLFGQDKQVFQEDI